MLTSGVYFIKNITNDFGYLGSSYNLEYRWQQHKRNAKNGKHENSYFQRAWNKYGENSFIFEVIEFCSCGVLVEREQFWLDLFWFQENLNIRKRNLYNINPIANKPPNRKGIPLTSEHKKKIGDAQVKDKNHNYGKSVSKDTRIKMSISHGFNGIIVTNGLVTLRFETIAEFAKRIGVKQQNASKLNCKQIKKLKGWWIPC